MEHVVLFGMRPLLAYVCRTFILRGIHSDLRSWSSPTLAVTSPDKPARSNQSFSEADSDTESTAPVVLPLPTGSTEKAVPDLLPSTMISHASFARHAFSTCFSESVLMFLLLLCQALNIFTPSARQLHWTFAILILLFLIIVLIPFIMSFVTIMGPPYRHGRRFDSVRTCFVLVLMALYLLGFSYIPVPAGVNSTDIVGLSFARLVVLGTTILGILSGFGAVSNAWDHLPWLSRQRSAPSHAQVQAVRERLTTTQVDIAMLSEQIQNQDSTTTSRQWSFNSIVSQLRGGDERAQVLRGLQALEVQMSRQLEDLEQRLTKAERERTFHGRMLNLTGFVFAAYCCLRVLSSIIHICSASTSSRTTSDLLTDLIAYAVSVLTPSATLSMDDVAIISHQISLVLVGVIILSSLRQVLRGVTRVLKVTSRNLGASLMLMVVAQLMGIYLLATIVQLRTSFPPDPVENNLFSTIPEYEVFGALFDWAFLITAVVSGCTRWVAEWATTDATD